VTSIVLRRATVEDAAAIAAVRIDSWRSTYRGIMPDAYLDGMRLEDSTASWTQVLSADANKTSVFVAEKDSEVVGFAAGRTLDEPKFGLDAELAAIYLRPDLQRIGIGRRLVSMVADAHQAQKATGLLVWVLTVNKAARQFFEQLNAEFLVEQSFAWDGLDLMETAYGWRDLQTLATAYNQ
jgi:ribosomal protein S18 acetylase RimI-like enzyme